MKMDTTQQVAGHPILRIRDLFKNEIALNRYHVERKMKCSAEEAVALLDKLVAGGYLVWDGEREGYWAQYDLLPPARSLGMARAVSPIKREKADRLLAEFLARVQEVNTSADFLWRVEKVVVFGSYLRPDVAELNDLDLVVTFERKVANPTKYEKLREKQVGRAQREGRSFSTFMEMLAYPLQKTLLHLRKRSRYLSLHRDDDQVLLQTETRQVFPVKAASIL